MDYHFDGNLLVPTKAFLRRTYDPLIAAYRGPVERFDLNGNPVDRIHHTL